VDQTAGTDPDYTKLLCPYYTQIATDAVRAVRSIGLTEDGFVAWAALAGVEPVGSLALYNVALYLRHAILWLFSSDRA